MNFKEKFSKYVEFKSWGKNKHNHEEGRCSCLFHGKDENPSMSIDVWDGVFHCFTCGASGDYPQFLKRLGVEIEDEKTIPPEDVEKWHKELKADVKALKFLKDVRGWSGEVINKHKIGFDGKRFSIPISNKAGQYLNIRRYRPKDKNKVISYGKGYGKSRLFPFSSLESNPVLIMEGEPDTLCALSAGFNAVTQTTGAGTWKVDQSYPFKDKDVVIAYDNDKAGKEGAEKVAITLMNKAKSIRIIELPVEETEDFTDYIVKYKHTKDDFIKLVKSTKDMKADRKLKVEKVSKPVKTDLFSSSKGEFYGKNIQVPVLVVGKDLTPYMLPRKIQATCTAGMKKCQACPLGGGQVETEFDVYHPDILNMVDQRKKEINAIVTWKLGALCSSYEWQVTESINVEDISVVADVEYSVPEEDTGGDYVITNVYYIGHGIRTNMTYNLEGTVYPAPKTQHATILVSEADPKQDNIASFNLDDAIMKRLMIFRRK
ncbi:MAG: hypothetical protein CMB80_09290 [Flammeovirgaceae bacterium]|nr:hypothetical protein [Flammeovirgaceae bacterium]